jgi:chromosome partitioning protein
MRTLVTNNVNAWKLCRVAILATRQQAYSQRVSPFSRGAGNEIAAALPEQMPVWKVKKTAVRKAPREVRALTDYVFEKRGAVR